MFVVPTTDLAASIRFYRDGLGLELTEEWDDMGRTALGLQVRAGDVDAIYARLEKAGARLKAPPRVRAWGMRGFGAFDPTGVPVNVYAPVGDA